MSLFYTQQCLFCKLPYKWRNEFPIKKLQEEDDAICTSNYKYLELAHSQLPCFALNFKLVKKALSFQQYFPTYCLTKLTLITRFLSIGEFLGIDLNFKTPLKCDCDM